MGISKYIHSDTLLLALVCAAMMIALAPRASAQTVGPITPPPKFELKKIPAKPNPGTPPLPSEEIIHRFTQNEDAIKKAYDSKSMDQTVRVEELVNNGGEFDFMGEQYTKPDGQRYERVIKPPTSTLHYTEFSLEDVKTLGGYPLFFLTTDHLPEYKLSYEGHAKLDEIDTYIFRVEPKQLGSKPLFDGVVWVDDQDFAIVKSYGRFVTVQGPANPDFPFSMFETYRENLEGRLWFPTYIRSDSEVKTPKGSVSIRLIMRSANFKTNSTAASPAAGSLNPSPQS